MKIKICGICRVEDGLAACAAGADFLGFIFYPPSARYLTPERAEALIAQLPPGPERVGVFVDEAPERMLAIARQCGLSRLQVHGRAAAAPLPELAGFPLLRAFAPRGRDELPALATLAPDQPILIDTPCAGFGGSGLTGDWELARELAAQRPLLLAGGLSPANVAEAIRRVRPWGVDVSSGVELRKGEKDHGKIREFIAAARAAAGS